MRQTIAHLTLVVRNYDEALDFFTQKLGFQLLADSPLPDGKRWVLVAPSHSKGAALLLAEAATPQQSLAIGNQTGGCVFLFLHTDDFWRDFHAYQSRGVRFLETPRNEPYGTVAVFEDLYGNKWDLLQPTDPK
jgi:catechol 2,3-dioxygenase-like lactoylglutathione lyase family enzyme